MSAATLEKQKKLWEEWAPNHLALLYAKLEPVSRQTWTPIEIGRMGPLLTSKLDRGGFNSDECKQSRHQCPTWKQSHCKEHWLVVTLYDMRTLWSVYKVLHRLQPFNFQLDYSSSVACSSSHCYTNPESKHRSNNKKTNYTTLHSFKILETYCLLQNYWFLTPSVCSHQFGFVSKRSTVQQLLLFFARHPLFFHS